MKRAAAATLLAGAYCAAVAMRIDRAPAGMNGAVDARDRVRTTQRVPNDEGFPNQWPLAMMNMPQAWDISTGDESIVIAVVDTGIIDHPDLRERFVAGYDFIRDPILAGDGDGRDPDPTDVGDETEHSSGLHGAHITGILGATTDNHVGMAAVNWRSKIQSVRALGVIDHHGHDSDIADAIRWAAGLNIPGVPPNETPAKVINLSFGGAGYSQALQDAVHAATARGALVVASAGNDSGDALNNVPGALEDVLCVGAAGPDGKPADYSNAGARVDLLAPGGAFFQDAPSLVNTPGTIWSTSLVRSAEQPVFAYAAGTSQAAAHASGVAALVRAVAPSLGPGVVAAILRETAKMPAGGCPNGCGAGVVDAAQALAVARDIAVAKCGAIGCGGEPFEHAPLRPEEGCAVAVVGGPRASRSSTLRAVADFAGIASVAALAAVGVVRRRRASPARGACAFLRRASLAALAVLLVAVGCSSVDGSRVAQSLAPPTVRIVDPIPTSHDGALVIAIGPEGRTITAEIGPPELVDEVEQVVLHAVGPDVDLVRVAHGPFQFFVPASVLPVGDVGIGHEGRTVCVVVTLSSGAEADACFTAMPR